MQIKDEGRKSSFFSESQTKVMNDFDITQTVSRIWIYKSKISKIQIFVRLLIKIVVSYQYDNL